MIIEDLKRMDLINKVGGKYKLAALVQKRMRELMQGSRPLIEDVEGLTHMEIVLKEIQQDKIAADFGTAGMDKVTRK